MAILLNTELATTGLIYEIIKQKKIELGKDFSWKHVNEVVITPEMVTGYSAWLIYSDCGPVITNFDNGKILSVFEKNTGVLKKVNGEQYVINIDPDTCALNHDDQDFMPSVMKYLISEFHPKMNYSGKFTNFIFNELDPIKEKTKVKSL